MFHTKIEQSIGKFLWPWSGKVLRVSIKDVMNRRENGGLGLVCIAFQSKSLLLSQLLRLIRDGDDKTLNHMFFWIGDVLNDLVPSVSQPFHFHKIPFFYETLAHIVVEAKLSGTVSLGNWRLVTNKMLYRNYVSTLPLTKIEQDSEVSLSETWMKINLFSKSSAARETVYLLIHNKLATKERLFRVGLVNDPYCESCLNDSGARICDRAHFFCTCMRVCEVWTDIRRILLALLPVSLDIQNVSNLDLITLNFPKSEADSTFLWLLGSYLEETWKVLYTQSSVKLNKGRMFGFLRYKYKKDQLGSRVQLMEIPEFKW